MTLTLVIGNKNYSSWSLRPWLALRHAKLPFEETVVPLDRPETASLLAEHSPSRLVPVLKTSDGPTVWDTMAICEYVAELAPEAGLWPADPQARAVARSVAAEMHSGFASLRKACPMNIRRRSDHAPAADVLADLDRIKSVWRSCRRTYGDGGPFLFGRFTIADAMYAPVCTRFRTYGLPEDGVATAYIDAVYDHPAMRDWIAAAEAETWTIPRSDL